MFAQVFFALALAGLCFYAAIDSFKLAAQNEAEAKEKIEFVRKLVLTNPEAVLYERLGQAFPEANVAPKMSAAALVSVKEPKYAKLKGMLSESNLLKGRIDFVVLDKSTGQVQAVVEFDEESHAGTAQKVAEIEREGALKSVGYRFARFDAKSLPSVEQLKQTLGEAAAASASAPSITP